MNLKADIFRKSIFFKQLQGSFAYLHKFTEFVFSFFLSPKTENPHSHFETEAFNFVESFSIPDQALRLDQGFRSFLVRLFVI